MAVSWQALNANFCTFSERSAERELMDLNTDSLIMEQVGTAESSMYLFFFFSKHQRLPFQALLCLLICISVPRIFSKGKESCRGINAKTEEHTAAGLPPAWVLCVPWHIGKRIFQSPELEYQVLFSSHSTNYGSPWKFWKNVEDNYLLG